MGNVFENHSYRYASRGRPPLSEAGYSLCWAAGTFPTAPSPAELPAGLAGSGPTRSGRGRASSVQQQPPWPGVRCYRGKEGGGRGIASPLRLLEAARDGECFSSACLPPSILPLFPPCKAAAARDGRNLSRGAAVPGQSGAGEHMAGVTMAAPCSLLPAPPFPPPLPRPWPGRSAVTVLRADRVTAGPLAEHGQGPLHRRHLPARARRHTHREGTGGRGAAGWPGGREARWERAPLREGAVGRGAPRGGRGRFPSLPNPGARHRPASSRDWRARLNKESARRGGARGASTSF